jgi:hypothetical protein
VSAWLGEADDVSLVPELVRFLRFAGGIALFLSATNKLAFIYSA